ncbi:MAG: hypothetical protein FWF71_03460 [Actinomycetia bacterium]|nr:hypothetical protein [Actinomycetes bacterium]
MRECPYCHTLSFDDMSICYGCLHRFEQTGSTSPEAKTVLAVADAASDMPHVQDGAVDGHANGQADIEGSMLADLLVAPDADLDRLLTEHPPAAPSIPSDLFCPEIAATDDCGRPTVAADRGIVSGMARLHVELPEGYHYDIYLEKPEGASIQIGWAADAAFPVSAKPLPPAAPQNAAMTLSRGSERAK